MKTRVKYAFIEFARTNSRFAKYATQQKKALTCIPSCQNSTKKTCEDKKMGMAFGAMDILFVVNKYFNEGAEAAMIEAARSAFHLGFPEYAVVILGVELGKEIFMYTFKSAGNYFIFAPINCPILGKDFRLRISVLHMNMEGEPISNLLSRNSLLQVSKCIAT